MSDAIQNLGPRLRSIRLASEKSLREVARRLDVSPSFLSQIENGKSQPSVATLYALARLLGVPVDSLFSPVGTAEETPASLEVAGDAIVSRANLSHPTDAWESSGARLSLISPQNRSVLAMDTGVRWERLAATLEADINFMEIVYEPGAGSNADGQLIQHEGYEYGYVLDGEVEVTIGESVLSLSKNQSIGFDSSVPHRLRNSGLVTFRGIWFVHAGHGAH